METKICKSEEKVGLMLASGLTKKEAANRLGKSFYTVNEQTRHLYEKLGCRNLADLTRKMISRYSGIDTEELLVRAMHDSLYLLPVVAVAMILVFMDQDGLIDQVMAFAERLKTAVAGLF